MLKRLLPLVVTSALIWSGCGGNKSTPAPAGVTVAISPTTASVAGATTQQFTATVTGSTNTAVTWQVNGVTGGDPINGTISTTGLYTAPNVLPSNTSLTVTAVSQADATKSAAAAVTLTPPAVTVTISPTSATLAAGASQQFTGTVTGNSNTAVTWSVSNVPGGNSTVGTVTTSGLYTAPASPPRGSITVTATSQVNTTFSASASITPRFGNASLNGTYVFLVNQGDNSSGSGFAYRGGTFRADGAGRITAGISDANSSATGPATKVSFAGTYSVLADGRGTIMINDASGAHPFFSFVLTSSTRGQLIAFDSAVTSGFMRSQDAAAITGVSGPFVFSLSGDNGGPAAAVGQLVFSAATVTGTEDVNSGGSLTAGTGLAGSFLVGAGGRGTATLNGAQFAFYIIDATTLVLLDIDPSGLRAAGTAFAQSTTPFTNSSLGSSAFSVSGAAVSGSKPFALAARFDTNSAGQFSGGIMDVNNAGNLTLNSSFAAGASYSVAANGRALMSTGSSNFILWLASQKRGAILETDSTSVASGTLFQQQTGFQSVTGGYGFVTSGANSAGTAPQAVDGQLTTSGFGSLTGTQDVNSNGSLQAGQSLTGNLAIATNGRATGSISILSGSSVNYSFYFISPDRFLMLSSDGTTVLSGIAERQCSDCQF